MERDLFFLFFLITLMSCNTRTRNDDQNTPITYIDFFSLKEKELIELNNKNECDNFILLKSGDNQALFGRIDKVKIKNGRIYIADTRLKVLVVYDNQGNNLGTVGKFGQGPDEYLNIADFDVDDNGNIYLLDGRLNKMFVYNSLFECLRIDDLPFEADVFQTLDNGSMMFGLSSWNHGQNENDKIIVLDSLSNVIQRYFSYDKYSDPTYWISSYGFSRTSECIAYNQTINNDVYVFSFTGQLKEIIRFDFGKFNVPDVAKIDVESKINDFDDYCLIKKNSGVTNKYIIGSVWKQRETNMFVIDRKTNICYLSDKINDLDKNFMCAFNDPFIVSSIDSENDILYPDSVNKHLQSENVVLKIQKTEH